MSFNGGYGQTGPTNGYDDYERDTKRRKTSPSGTIKAPQPPNAKPSPEERMDINDLSDLVVSSGIDLRKEEDYLANSYQYRQTPQPRPSHHPTGQHQYGSIQQQSQPTNFDLLSRTNFPAIGQRNNQAQPPSPHPHPEEELESKQKRAARTTAEAAQYHLNDPFLQGFSMRQRMERIANDNGIKVTMSGLYDKINHNKPDPKPIDHTKPYPQSMSTPQSAVDRDDAPSMLTRNAPLDPMFSLISLAANERVRGLLEDAFSLTRGRQITADGRIPPEYRALTSSITTADDPSEASSATTTNKSTSINAILTAAARTDRAAEVARLKKRAERKARRDRLASSNPASTDPTNPSLSADGTPLSLTDGNVAAGGTLVGSMAPEVKMSKKELERQKKADMANEEAQTRNANSAVAMALGGKSKYAWMNKAKGGAGGASGTSTPMRGVGTAKAAGGASGAAGTAGGSGAAAGGTAKAGANVNGATSMALGKDGLPPPGLDRTYGVWREDGPGGRDVQLRDWIGVLEGDGRERKALALSLLKLGRERLLE